MPDIMEPNPLMHNQREAWDYRYRMKGRQWGNAPTEISELPDSGIILELGVGDGKNLRARRLSGAYYIGLDFSREALYLCQKEPVLSGIPLLLADACHIPIRDALVNKVYAHHILGHLSSLLTPVLISEIFRVLCPNGQLIITVFSSGDMRDNTGKEVEPSTYLRGDGIITRYYTEDMIRALCPGFIIREINRIEWPMRIRGKEYNRSFFTGLFEKPSEF